MVAFVKPCRKCGGTERYERNGDCKSCCRARAKASRLETPRKRPNQDLLSKPCLKCGTSNRCDWGNCITCQKIYKKREYTRNKNKYRERNHLWILSNKEWKKNYDREYVAKNKAYVKKHKSEWHVNNRARRIVAMTRYHRNRQLTKRLAALHILQHKLTTEPTP